MVITQQSSPLTSKHFAQNKTESKIVEKVISPRQDPVILALKPKHFTNGELETMPVVFAFCLEDDDQSMNKANIRTRLWDEKITRKDPYKRVALKKPAKSSRGRAVPILVSEGPAGADLPTGWTVKIYQRMSGHSKGHLDQYWFSPTTKKKMRSRVEIARFLVCLKNHEGDEEKAFAKLKGR
mmetsp:Transcript_8728/g.8296  ORF Transcript_8728/g.8296 Transcript_8728/m.8296 type:complete len:182 (-) Transcript_8728:327-872(-)